MKNLFPYLAILTFCTPTTPLCAQEGGAPPAPPKIQAPAPTAPEDYTISRQDILSVVVIDQPSFTGKYPVEIDGSVRFPLIGRMPAAGKTLRELERELKRALTDGFFKNPQVVVSLDQFRGKKIFVWGAAGPGTFPLGDGDTILEVLVKIGASNQSEAVIIRPKSGPAGPRPLSSGMTDAETIRVNMRELEKEAEQGNFSRNLALQDGDTIFLPRVDRNRVYVTGQVKAPNAYSVPEGTTVMQVIALAGGLTESGTTRGIKIQRIVNGKNKNISVKLDDVVQPGDTVVVGERIF